VRCRRRGVMRRSVVALGLMGAVAVALAGRTLAREPALVREWDEDVRVLSGVEPLPDGAVLLSEVRR
jgi:hypothetical protein